MEVDTDAEEDGAETLRRACERGDVEVATALLSAGESANKAAKADGVTPLLAACLSGNAELVDRLLRAAADPEAMDTEGSGVALCAAESGSVLLLAALLDRGLATLAECAADGTTPLLSAAAGGSAEMVAWLLDGPQGAAVAPSLEERDERGADALLAAAEAGSLPVLRELLRRGAAAGTIDASGCGALHFAAAGGSVAAVKFCVQEMRIPCSIRDHDGDTPLLIAAHEGHCEVVEWLLRNGSSLSERNNGDMSAAMMAAAGEQTEVMELLAKKSSGGQLWVEEIDRHPDAVLRFLEDLGAMSYGAAAMTD